MARRALCQAFHLPPPSLISVFFSPVFCICPLFLFVFVLPALCQVFLLPRPLHSRFSRTGRALWAAAEKKAVFFHRAAQKKGTKHRLGRSFNTGKHIFLQDLLFDPEFLRTFTCNIRTEVREQVCFYSNKDCIFVIFYISSLERDYIRCPTHLPFPAV